MNNSDGLISTIDKVISEVLKKQNVKNTIRIVLNSIDPDSSEKLAKNLLWNDPELSLSIASVVPAIINSTLTFVDTGLSELKEKIPPAMLQNFSENLLSEIDTEKIINIKNNFNEIFSSLFPLAKEIFNPK